MQSSHVSIDEYERIQEEIRKLEAFGRKQSEHYVDLRIRYDRLRATLRGIKYVTDEALQKWGADD